MHIANVERGERSLAVTRADMTPRVLHEFYPANRHLMIRIRDPRYAIRYSLSPGDMVAFDNRRVLHERTAFNAGFGDRHLYS